MRKTSSKKEKGASKKFLDKLAESKRCCPSCEKQKILKRVIDKVSK